MQFENDKFTALAKIGKPVGLKGVCRLFPFGDTVGELSLPETLWVGDKRGVTEVKLVSAVAAGKNVLRATFEGYSDCDAVDVLKNQMLYIERDRLPETEEDEYYFQDLIGLMVETETGVEFGKVVDVFNFPTTDAIEIQPKSGKKVLLPFRKETVISVQIDERKIIVESEHLDELTS